MSGKRAKQARRAAIQGTTKSAPPERPLPMGVQLRVVSDPDTMRMVDSAAAEFISDYSPPAQMARGLEQRWSGLQSLFAGDPRPVPSIFAVVAVNDAGDGMYGAATLEPFLGEDLTSQDREVARNVAALHRVLGSLFVVPDARGNGIGGALLDAASLTVVQDQGRYVEGFVDDRDGSVGFYRRAGAYVGSHNEPLPPRPPIHLKTTHYPGKNGHWFSVDGWAHHPELLLCGGCGQAPDFDPETDGMPHCPRCQGTRTPAAHGVAT